MVKAYLRYEHSASFGVILSNSNLLFGADGKSLISSSLENVSVWNIKQGNVVASLVPGNSDVPSSSTAATASLAEVTCTAQPPSGQQLAVGYSDGSVRLWNLLNNTCTATLKGHKSAISSLRYHPNSGLLASGSKDTDIIVWDVLGEAGLYRLRGHKDQVTDVAFISRLNKLVSCSKDTHVRVWDLDSQRCTQTLTGHPGEVWTLDVDPAERRLVTGCTDHELRVYAIAESDAEPTSGGDSHTTLRPMGGVKRQAKERMVLLRYHPSGSFLAAQGAGKTLELFRVRSEDESKKKEKRRKKRKREKAGKGGKAGDQAADGEDAGDAEGAGEDGEGAGPQAGDELEPAVQLTARAKLRSFAFNPLARRKGGMVQLALGLTNNAIEVVDVAEDGGSTTVSRLEGPGHRSDVRALALSPDDNLLLSASNSAVKLWNPTSGACLGTVESGYGLCILFAPGGRHAVVGTKEGTIELFDLGSLTKTHVENAHAGPVWSLAALHDKSGFVSGSADHELRWWQWEVGGGEDGGRRSVSFSSWRNLRMADDVLSVRTSSDGKMLAVALLDATVKVFFADSLKFFLSLYGHKLPVLSMDISSDNTLLVTGSADKNIKVWGLDFGDCHKSMFAHNDAVTSVAFVPGTHYVFTAGKDKMVKYWDVDKFELLLEMTGHHGEVWALTISNYGDFFITGSHDRSLRRWERTSEPFFVEEEKERRLESLFEANLEVEQERSATQEAGEEASVAPAGRKTGDAVSGTDAIIDALDLAANEAEKQAEHAEALAQSGAGGAARAPAANPLLLGMDPASYVLRAVSAVRSSDLEAALLMLPFTDALKLMGCLPRWLRDGTKVELTCRTAFLLLRLHHQQLLSTPSARGTLTRLQQCLHSAVAGLKGTMGFNLAALRHMQRTLQDRTTLADVTDATPQPTKRLLQS